MIRHLVFACLILLPLAAYGWTGTASAELHRAARAETELDGVGLIDESDRLTSAERHFLPPLSEAEVARLFDDDARKPEIPKIGIERSLTSPVRFAIDAGSVRAKRLGEGLTVAGGRLHGLDDGTLVWTTAVSSPGSDSLRFRFDEIHLPDNARVFVYGADGERYGPYTRSFVEKVTLGTQSFWSHTIQGSEAFVEVQFDESSGGVVVSIDGVGHFESAAIESVTAQPEGTECFVDVSCATDDAELMAALTTATAQLRYLEGGAFYVCSGSLVNVSRTPEIEPYLLTANHCISSQSSASSLEAWWDYRTSECGGATPTKSGLPKVIGSTLLAGDESSDFTFLELTSTPAGSTFADGGRYYLGWTTDAPDYETSIFRASHPNGGKQMWSRNVVINPLNQTCSGLPASRFIYSAGSYGGTTGGSSGASAANADGQIVGQNYGKCGTDLTDPCSYSAANTVDGAFFATYEFIDQWLSPGSGTEPCGLSDSTICLQGGRFEVQLEATDPRTGNTDEGYVMASTSFFGYYAFPVLAGNQTDPQVFVKVLDGRPINGRWWVFYASLTDVEFTLTVRDTQTGASKSYRQEPYTQVSRNDTSAFDD